MIILGTFGFTLTFIINEEITKSIVLCKKSFGTRFHVNKNAT